MKRFLALPLALFPALTVALPAQAALPTGVTIRDGGDAKGQYDIRTVGFYSASEAEPASVSVTMKKAPKPGSVVFVWLNLDKDKKPDVLFVGMTGSHYSVQAVDGWRKPGKDIFDRGCGKMSVFEKTVEVSFTPNCLGKAKRMQVSVATATSKEKFKDFAPKKFKWSKKIRAWQ